MDSISLKPRVSEKAYAQSEAGNVYIFDIGRTANKFDIARAVKIQYDVHPIKVRIVAVPGKSVKRFAERGRKSFKGHRSDLRKAYVTLKEGDKLPIFAAVEEPDAPKEKK
jgi:large subunit ribosomal protein L23